MSSLSVGVLGGVVLGVVAVLSMLPLEFPDKRAALCAAFLNRFAIGVAIGAAQIAWPGWAMGLMFGLLLSVPDAIITKAWAPIIGMGAVGGVLIGLAASHWGVTGAGV
jgi:hypothetical protein